MAHTEVSQRKTDIVYLPVTMPLGLEPKPASEHVAAGNTGVVEWARS